MAGNITIIETRSNFQKVAKGIIFDKGIDPFTLGIYVKVLALGKEWNLNIVGLASYLNVSDAKIRKAFGILEQAGYLRRFRVKDPDTKRFVGWDYEVGEDPFPTEQRTDIAGSRNTEKPTFGKPECRESRNTENQQVYNIDNKEVKTKKEVENKFNFRTALLELGISVEIVDTWMEVRRKKGAVNSEIAFKDLCTEIAKTGESAEECVRIAAANSWRGFKAEYLRPRNIVGGYQPRKQESVFEANARAVEEIRRKYENLNNFTDEQ